MTARFASHYRAMHEVNDVRLIRLFIHRQDGWWSDADAKEWLRSLASMAGFLDISVDTFDPGGAPAKRASTRFGIVQQLDSAFLEDRVVQFGDAPMKRFFAEMRSPLDAGLEA
jgi:hypothetical protein